MLSFVASGSGQCKKKIPVPPVPAGEGGWGRRHPRRRRAEIPLSGPNEEGNWRGPAPHGAVWKQKPVFALLPSS